MGIVDTIKRPIAAVSGTLVGLVSLGHLTGAELVGVITSSAGSWFSAIAVGSTTVIPNLDPVLSGEASTSTYVLVAAGAVYVVILSDRVADRLQKKWDD